MLLFNNHLTDRILNRQPHFFRCRTVEIIDGKYATCSCGFPVRYNSFPCRHILAIFKETRIEMFGIRWLIQYQHSYQRKGKAEITRIFKNLQEIEFRRKAGDRQDVFVQNLLDKDIFTRPPDQMYPIPIHGTTSTQMETVLDLDYHISNKGPLIRGTSIPSRQAECSDIIHEIDDESTLGISDNTEKYEPQSTIQYSQQTQEMIRDDKEFRAELGIVNLQRSLRTMANTITNSCENKHQRMTGLGGELNKITEENNTLNDAAANDMLLLIQKYTKLMIESTNPDKPSNDGVTLSFAETGLYHKKKRKEKKDYG